MKKAKETRKVVYLLSAANVAAGNFGSAFWVKASIVLALFLLPLGASAQANLTKQNAQVDYVEVVLDGLSFNAMEVASKPEGVFAYEMAQGHTTWAGKTQAQRKQAAREVHQLAASYMALYRLMREKKHIPGEGVKTADVTRWQTDAAKLNAELVKRGGKAAFVE